MSILGLIDEQNTSVTVSLTDETDLVGDYKAEIIGSESGEITGNGSLTHNLNGVEAVMYQISPVN